MGLNVTVWLAPTFQHCAEELAITGVGKRQNQCLIKAQNPSAALENWPPLELVQVRFSHSDTYLSRAPPAEDRRHSAR
jgi:hypothetical protein